jgi:hypothetical protein
VAIQQILPALSLSKGYPVKKISLWLCAFVAGLLCGEINKKKRQVEDLPLSVTF